MTSFMIEDVEFAILFGSEREDIIGKVIGAMSTVRIPPGRI